VSILDLVNVRWHEGFQAIKKPRSAVLDGAFRGIPELAAGECGSCDACTAVCAARAIAPRPLAIDLGRCTLCGDCARACPAGRIRFSNEHRMGASARESLVVREGDVVRDYSGRIVPARREVRRILGRSLRVRSVSAGGCNGCELELNATGNVNFDIGRYGIEIVASPRHADALLLTGPVTAAMAGALDDVWRMMPEPKLFIAAGACAISGGVFDGSPALDRSFFDGRVPDLCLPGCPVHPLTFVEGILGLLGR